MNYISLALEAFAAMKETDTVAHADELETSLYLYLAPDRVRMDRAVADDDPAGRYMSADSTPNYPVRLSDYWGRWTRTGVHGDPTTATAEKGKVIFEAAVSRLIEIADEFRAWPLEARSDQHVREVQKDIRW